MGIYSALGGGVGDLGDHLVGLGDSGGAILTTLGGVGALGGVGGAIRDSGGAILTTLGGAIFGSDLLRPLGDGDRLLCDLVRVLGDLDSLLGLGNVDRILGDLDRPLLTSY